MKLALVLSPVAIAACASSQPSPDESAAAATATATATTTATATATVATARPMTTTGEPGEAEVRAIAEKTAREAGYDLGVYQIKDVTVERTRAPNPGWVVFFVHQPPTPPGGHFTVYVNPETKTARLVPGE